MRAEAWRAKKLERERKGERKREEQQLLRSVCFVRLIITGQRREGNELKIKRESKRKITFRVKYMFHLREVGGNRC